MIIPIYAGVFCGSLMGYNTRNLGVAVDVGYSVDILDIFLTMRAASVASFTILYPLIDVQKYTDTSNS